MKQDDEDKSRVEEKKTKEAERHKAVKEESEKSRSHSLFARKHNHDRTMTP